ncbi:hypothetical protein [Brevundimonas subvibrioides]|uniref:hypothetical protein n=1 Tax=Brevundimonas subvibrioides TaxID=74313 RepID=UPI0022B49F60|nr:hypothetical protein [Brevundimonas subvibrioides]
MPEEAYPKSVWGGLVRHYRGQLEELASWSRDNLGKSLPKMTRGSEAEAWTAASYGTVQLYVKLLPADFPSWLSDFEGRKDDVSLSLSLVYPIFSAFSEGLVEERRVNPDAFDENLKSTLLSALTGSWPLFTPGQHVELAQHASRHFSDAAQYEDGRKFLNEIKIAATLWTAAAAENNQTAMGATETYLAQRFLDLRGMLKA